MVTKSFLKQVSDTNITSKILKYQKHVATAACYCFQFLHYRCMEWFANEMADLVQLIHFTLTAVVSPMSNLIIEISIAFAKFVKRSFHHRKRSLENIAT